MLRICIGAIFLIFCTTGSTASGSVSAAVPVADVTLQRAQVNLTSPQAALSRRQLSLPVLQQQEPLAQLPVLIQCLELLTAAHTSTKPGLSQAVNTKAQ